MNVPARLARLKRTLDRRQGAPRFVIRICDSDGRPVDGNGPLDCDATWLTFSIAAGEPAGGEEG